MNYAIFIVENGHQKYRSMNKKLNCFMFLQVLYGSTEICVLVYFNAIFIMSDSSVGVATCYGLDGPGIEFR